MTNILENFQEEQFSISRNKPEGAFLTLEDLNSMSYGSKVNIFIKTVLYINEKSCPLYCFHFDSKII